MIIPFYEEILSDKLNYNLTKLDKNNKSFGLLPLNVTYYPKFFTPNGKLYLDTTNHYNVRFKEDFNKSLHLVNNNPNYYRIEIRNSYFNENAYIINNKIILTKEGKEIYSIVPEMIKRIEHVIGTKLTMIEYDNNQSETEIIYNEEPNFKNVLRVKYKPSIEEKVLIEKSKYIKEIKKENITTRKGKEILDIFPKFELEYNSGIYTRGIYNEKTLELYNELIENKRNMYDYATRLCEISNNPKQALKSLKELLKNVQEEDFFTDVLVQNMNYDLIEEIIPNTIITSKNNINETFFNYLIMDFNVKQIPKIVFNQDKQQFVYKDNEFIKLHRDVEYEEEINLIKKYIPMNERKNYFK